MSDGVCRRVKREVPPLARQCGLVSRRDWLLGVATCGLTAPAAAAPGTPVAEPRVEDIEVPGWSNGSLKARVLSPASGARPRRCLILLHGLGETARVDLGLKAWSHLYGLIDAQRRLSTPPVERNAELDYFPPARLDALNESLERRPYQPMVLICPVTPRPAAGAARKQRLDEYARWLIEHLLPAVEQRHPGCSALVGLDGCSMGGYVATEVLIRKPAVFTTFGVVQCAIGEWRVPGYVQALARVHAQRQLPIHLQTSSRDPFKAATISLAKGLDRAQVPHRLEVLPGPHDQPWLREVGTLMMLRWHDRQLRRP